jgi:hypothetical protein
MPAAQFRLPYLLEVRPSSEFAYESAKNKLVSLKLGSDTGPQVTFVVPGDVVAFDDADDIGFEGRHCHLLRLAAWIDVESKITVCLAELMLNCSHVTPGGLRWCSSFVSTAPSSCWFPSRRCRRKHNVPYIQARNVQLAGFHVGSLVLRSMSHALNRKIGLSTPMPYSLSKSWNQRRTLTFTIKDQQRALLAERKHSLYTGSSTI